MSQSFKSVIIIGAGRSGTNILRDSLTKIPGVGTWPCDEINYIWRHGNIYYPTDELPPDRATPAVRHFIQTKFLELAKQQSLSYIIEKTCANSLRVGFVNAVIPGAKYIFIVRDGRDVVASAIKRWSAPLDLSYIAAKALYVPASDLFYYGFRYFGNRLYRLISREKRLALWGPRFEGMQEMLHSNSLPVVCAQQWRRCVERSEEEFQKIDPSQLYTIQYEHLVNDPSNTLVSIFRFLELEIKELQIKLLSQNILPDSVGKWQMDLSAETMAEISPILQPVQDRYGYV